ncbi:MAG: CDP-alcohol phosphatidyltransferase family protein [Oscillospiraceae bacterium]|jgi:cardiolipin synthase|nr:CDP-alcohol phosphatidyltransferase family protein [Oscillospiraceae bacterium]MBQ2384141.1 CDP-alcohol phosphatidyltransferase family protein [Oscillospiraceae bacterium]MBQ5711671.1 CDP-alcohol phosphatidyltransferase family protein [Oscillospiraceae bacterium]
MMIKDWKKEIFTIPNLLSLFRLILIPVYVAIYLNATESVHYTIAGTILAVSCLTDMIDGKIARHFNMTSTVGQVLDPIADKATQFTLMVSLAIEHPVLWIVAGFFVLKESFQLIAGFVFYRKGKMLTGALMSGKICTTVLFLTLILMVLFPGLNGSAITVFAVIDGLFMLIAFVDYAQSYIRQTPIIQDIDKT